MKNFVIYRWIEVVLIIAGLILFFYFQTDTLWKGVGTRLIIQRFLMLVLDFYAKKRGEEYVKFLLEK